MKYLHFLKHIATSASILLLAAACTGDTGSEGNLKFQDKSGVSSNQVLPVAQGRTVNYTITNTAFSPKNQDVEDAESSDETVFRVKSVSGSSVSIEGVGEGNATLTVTTEKGVRDRLDLEVRKPHTTYYSIDKVNDETVVGGLLDVGGKYNLSPQDEIEFERHIFVDENGARLSGEEASEFEQGSEGDTSIGARTLTAGSEDEALSVENAYGGTLSVRVVDDYAPDSLIGYMHAISLGELDVALLSVHSGTTFELQNGAYSLRVHPKDAEGYAYIGSTGLDAQATLKTPDAVKMTYQGRREDGGGEVCRTRDDSNSCIVWQNLPELVFLVTTQEDAVGPAEIEVTTGGVTETITLNL